MGTETEYSPSMGIPLSDAKPDFAKYMLDPEEIIDEIEHKWNGDTFDRNTMSWKINTDPDKKMMVGEGITFYSNFLGLYLKKIFPLTNYTEQQINTRMRIISNEVINSVFSDVRRYKIKKPGMVISMIIDPIDAMFFRAKDNQERRMQKEINTVNRTEYEDTSQKNKSILSGFFKKQ